MKTQFVELRLRRFIFIHTRQPSHLVMCLDEGSKGEGIKGESGNKTKRWSAMVDGQDSVSWQGQDVVHALLLLG